MLGARTTETRGAWLAVALTLLGTGCGGKLSTAGKTHGPTGDEDDTSEVVSCPNGVTDGTETDVDCGGECPRCEPGQLCSANGDCSSDQCRDRRCESTTTCSDGLENGDETDVDCGGASCTGCADGRACRVDDDCVRYASGSRCFDEVCTAPSCTDAILNGTETDLDCGGACLPCLTRSRCNVDLDCVDGLCALADESSTQTTCIAVHCSNGKVDSDETDRDCGGNDCVGCPGGYGCDLHRDCEFDSDFVCVAGTCHLSCQVSDDCGDGGLCREDVCSYCEGEGDCDFACGAGLSCVCKNGYNTCG
jgi:hypothetical protein